MYLLKNIPKLMFNLNGHTKDYVMYNYKENKLIENHQHQPSDSSKVLAKPIKEV